MIREKTSEDKMMDAVEMQVDKIVGLADDLLPSTWYDRKFKVSMQTVWNRTLKLEEGISKLKAMLQESLGNTEQEKKVPKRKGKNA